MIVVVVVVVVDVVISETNTMMLMPMLVVVVVVEATATSKAGADVRLCAFVCGLVPSPDDGGWCLAHDQVTSAQSRQDPSRQAEARRREN